IIERTNSFSKMSSFNIGISSGRGGAGVDHVDWRYESKPAATAAAMRGAPISALPTFASASRPAKCQLNEGWLSARGPSPQLGSGLRDQHPERQSVPDFQDLDGPVTNLVKVLEQLDDLGLEQEVARIKFGPGAVLTTEFDFPYHARRRVE